MFKDLVIDSTRRNRTVYPLPSDFVIPYTNGPPGNDFQTALDPVSLAVPYLSGTTQGGSTTTSIVLQANSSPTDNFYVNSLLDINNQLQQIINYVGSTQIATVANAFSAAPGAGTAYTLRKQHPLFTGIVQAGSTSTTLIFPNTASTVSGSYVGCIVVFSGIAIYKYITAYDGFTFTATLSGPLPFNPVGETFEIDGFSYDNAASLRYTGSTTLNNPMCYTLHMTELSIPNITLTVGNGGTIANYPAIYVHFYNDPSHSAFTMYGNNPQTSNATFRVPIPSELSNAVTKNGVNFITLYDSAFYSPQSIKLKVSENIRFRVTLPNGEPLQFIIPDNYSPLEPNYQVQISALFTLKMTSVGDEEKIWWKQQ